MSKITQEQIIKVVEQLGFKKYQAGKEVYFLQTKQKFSSMKKVKMKQMDLIFNGVEPKVELKPEPKVEPKTKPKPKTTKAKEVKKDE